MNRKITDYSHLVRLTTLIFGLFLLGLSIVIQVNAGLGYAPWTVLADGLSKKIGISLGKGEIGIGLVIVLIDVMAKEKVGLGTLANMILCGTFVDVIRGWNIIPESPNLAVGIAMLVVGSFILGIGCYLYMGAGYGAGPRDSLMVAVMKWTGKPMGICRSCMEIAATAVGYLLGGSVGVGTIVLAGASGYIIGYVFKLLKCDAKKIEHVYLMK